MAVGGEGDLLEFVAVGPGEPLPECRVEVAAAHRREFEGVEEVNEVGYPGAARVVSSEVGVVEVLHQVGKFLFQRRLTQMTKLFRPKRQKKVYVRMTLGTEYMTMVVTHTTFSTKKRLKALGKSRQDSFCQERLKLIRL